MNPTSSAQPKLGILGLDTSHALVFSDTFNTPGSPQFLPGARVVAAWPGGSPDLPASISRVPAYTAEVRDKFGVAILDRPEAVARASDAVLITAIDGRAHRALFERIAPLVKRVFIDKPFATSSADARAIFATAAKHGVRLFSSSSLRFSAALTRVVAPASRAGVRGADFCGAADLEPTNPGWYWYGIHAVEMLYTAMGRGCRAVRCVSTASGDLATGVWADGRIGSVRGGRTGNYEFHGVVHFEKHSLPVNVQTEPKSFYASLAEQILALAQGGPAPIEPEETVELIRFIEAANESSAAGGREVQL